jgi:hypothetical protein
MGRRSDDELIVGVSCSCLRLPKEALKFTDGQEFNGETLQLSLLHCSGDVIEAAFNGVKWDVEVGFSSEETQVGCGAGLSAGSPLEFGFVAGEYVMAGEGINHVRESDADGAQLERAEDAQEVPKHSFG